MKVNIATIGEMALVNLLAFPLTAPAFETALFELHQTYSSRFNFTQSFLYNPVTSDSLDRSYLADSSDVLAAQWYYMRKPDADLTVFIYPGAREVTNINRLTSGWNTLMITSAAATPAQRDKKISPTWLATGCCLQIDYGYPYVLLMTANQWTSVFLVLDTATLLMPKVVEVASNLIRGVMRSQQIIFTIPDGGRNDTNYRKLLSEMTRQSRVMFFFGHSETLRNILIQTYHLRKITEDYIYIALEPWPSITAFGDFFWCRNDSHDEIVKQAYKSVLIVAKVDYATRPGPKTVALFNEWKRRSRDSYNYTYGKNEEVDQNVVRSYLALLLFADVLNDTLSADPIFNFQDGTALARQFFNKTVIVDGIPFYIDEVGKRRTDMVIKQIHETTGNLEVIMTVFTKTNRLLTLKPIKWYGRNRFPANEPLCGFSGLSKICAPGQAASLYGVAGGVMSVFGILTLVMTVLWRKKVANEARADSGWWELEPLCLEIYAGINTTSGLSYSANKGSLNIASELYLALV